MPCGGSVSAIPSKPILGLLMAWRRLISLQDVDATIDGVHHRVLAAEWDDETGAVKIVWPPGAAAFASQSRRVVEPEDYEPADHYGFPGSFF
jgi:hypothetical protein